MGCCQYRRACVRRRPAVPGGPWNYCDAGGVSADVKLERLDGAVTPGDYSRRYWRQENDSCSPGSVATTATLSLKTTELSRSRSPDKINNAGMLGTPIRWTTPTSSLWRKP
ncbi:MAG: hypothetical protein JWM76_2774 [Pseudonocardiales bacterium]|nr:hypothetical protein [Pseudonocardiales bacterium]